MQQEIFGKTIPLLTTIESLSHDGRGISRIKNKITFIENALPGEEVAFVYTKKCNQLDMGRAVEILKPSAARVEPICKHYGICGGCTLQHLATVQQLAIKEQALREQLQHIAGIDEVKFLPPIVGPTERYRNKARLAVKYVTKKQQVLVGFHEKNGSYVVATEKCPILHPSIGEKLTELGALIIKLSVSHDIPQIEIACSNIITALVIRNLKPFAAKDLQLLQEFGEKHHIQFYMQPGGINSIAQVASSHTSLPLYYELQTYQVKITFVPINFTQINSKINLQLVQHVIELLDLKPNDKVLDLFCGIGNFTLPLATLSKNVVGVEGSGVATERARHNAAINNITNVTFYSADLMQIPLPQTSWATQTYTKILLDPPRTGAQEICAELKKFQFQKTVYVSCNAATFARDAKIIVAQGYKLQSVTLADMYPHTQHIEIVGVFI